MASVGKISSRVTSAKMKKIAEVLVEAALKVNDVRDQLDEWVDRGSSGESSRDEQFESISNTLERIQSALARISEKFNRG